MKPRAKKAKGGRPKKTSRVRRNAYLAAEVWEALQLVANARGARMRRAMSVPDLMEQTLLADAEIGREARRLQEGAK